MKKIIVVIPRLITISCSSHVEVLMRFLLMFSNNICVSDYVLFLYTQTLGKEQNRVITMTQ